MFIAWKPKKLIILLIVVLAAAVIGGVFYLFRPTAMPYDGCEEPGQENEQQIEEAPLPSEPQKTDFIKWVDFKVTYPVLEQAYQYDVKSYGSDLHLHWIELLAYVAAKEGNKFPDKKSSEMDKLVGRLKKGETMESITANMKYYDFYKEAYTAILGEFLGEYIKNETVKYGLIAFSPVAKGYSFSHYKDFGVSRSYGFTRRHLGNDLMGSIGTPIVAAEGGFVDNLGWNQYGGWRVGIRSFDGKRYYYYAHLRKDHPYPKTLMEGQEVKAGDVIGYLGMTGYSVKENVNNINTPHLHFGMQLIFDESQREGIHEIWIDVYPMIELLNKNKVSVAKDAATKDYYRVD